MSTQGNIKVSVLLSIYNRSELFSRGLSSYAKQNLPSDEFEIILIDDGSTENLYEVYKPYIGRLNIKHIKFDHKQHPIWREMNPIGQTEEHWFHTPALSTNIGIHHARGEVICTAQPELILNADALKYGYNHVKFGGYQAYGEVIMASERFNDWLKDCPQWGNLQYQELLERVDMFGREHNFGSGEYYWILAFYLREKCQEINGVDLEYLRGVYGEDDNFRVRIRLAKQSEYYGGRTDDKRSIDGRIIGIHQSHRHEANLYKKQNRDSNFWNEGAVINRKRWSDFCQNPTKMANQNLSFNDIWGIDCVTSIKEFHV